MKPGKAVVLLSAGLDSTVNLFEARAAGYEVVMALTADYGQRASVREIEASRKICASLGIRHHVVELPFIRDFGGSSLTDRSKTVPQAQQVSIDDMSVSRQTAKAVWVPNRNGLLLNLAAGYAEALGAEIVVPGFNAEEAKTFPDNTEEFLRALTASFSFSTANQVKAHCFTTRLEKPAIAQRARDLSVPIADLWFCYLEGERWCGTCESCQRNKRALTAAGFDTATLFGGVR